MQRSAVRRQAAVPTVPRPKTGSRVSRPPGAVWLRAALRYAGRGVHSAHEVEAFLARRGARPEQIDAALATCRGRGLVNDAAAARLWAEHWAGQGWAWAAIETKLDGRGFRVETIRALRAGYPALADDAARAAWVMAKVRGRSAAARQLAAHGFDADTIAATVGDAEDAGG